jgi:hypothetical protein
MAVMVRDHSRDFICNIPKQLDCRPNKKLDGSQQPRRQHDDGANQLKRTAHGDPNQPEGQ